MDSKTNMLPNLLFFGDEDAMIKDMIIHHGKTTCREQFDRSMISNAVKKCDFGFVSFTKRASIGKKKKGKIDEYTIHGFVLCQKMRGHIFISLICISEQYRGAGAKLLSEVISYAENDPSILRVTLDSLPELQSYYQKQQFDTIDTLRTKSGEIKVYHMSRKIEK